MLPELFIKWAEGYVPPHGVGVRPSSLLMQFKIFANPRFRSLGRVAFNDWVREYFKPIEEKTQSGLVFYFGQKGTRPKVMSVNMFMAYTSPEFVYWFEKNKEEMMYAPFAAKEMYDKFLEDMSGKIYEYVSKQEFNKWLKWAALFVTGNEPEDGRNAKGKTIKFKYNGQ